MLTFDVLLTTAHFPRYTQSEVLDNAVAYAVAAERLGYNGLWMTEHHFIPAVGLCSSSVTMASFLLGCTQRLRVGTAVCSLPLYHPVQIAEQVALIDQLSGGRFDFGIGKGGYPRDLAVFGRLEEELRPIMQEALEVILRTWTQDRVSADGAFVRFPPVTVYPSPRTRPHPPVYVICQSRPTIEMAARHGLPMMLSFTIDDDAKAAQLALYRDLAAQYGHDATAVEHICAVIGYVADSRQRAEQVVRPALEWFFEANHAALVPDDPRIGEGHHGHAPSPAAVRAHVSEVATRLLTFNPVGTPEQCARRLQDISECTGVRRFAIHFEFAGEHAAALENLERFANDVTGKMELPQRPSAVIL